jgi:hypothetical protein
MQRAPIKVVALIACLACAGAYADEFSWELSGMFGESEVGPSFETERWALQATHFFDSVDDADGPYALASFFDPESRVAVTWGHDEQTASFVSYAPFPLPPNPVTKTDDYSVSGRYVVQDSKWYFGGTYSKIDVDDPPSLPQQVVDASGYGLLIGKYIGSATTLELAYDTSERDSEFPILLCTIVPPCVSLGTGTTEEESEQASVNVLHVRRFRSMTYSLFGRVAGSSGQVVGSVPSVTFPPPVNITIPASTFEQSLPRMQTYSVGSEIFPTAKLGVRVGYTRWDDDTPADDAYDVATTWFVRRDLGLQFIYSRQSIDDGIAGMFISGDFDGADTTTVRVIGRF